MPSSAPRRPRPGSIRPSVAGRSTTWHAKSWQSPVAASRRAPSWTPAAMTRACIFTLSTGRSSAARRRPIYWSKAGATSGKVPSSRCSATTPTELRHQEDDMLDRCDRVQIAVRDAAKAAARYAELLGCQIARRDSSRHLAAKRTILAVGESEFELCEADGAGLTQDFLSRRGEGLMTAGYSTV